MRFWILAFLDLGWSLLSVPYLCSNVWAAWETILQEWEYESNCKAPQPKYYPRYDFLQPFPLPSCQGTDKWHSYLEHSAWEVGLLTFSEWGMWVGGCLCRKKKKNSGSVSHSVVSDSLGPHGLQPARLLCLCNFPGKNSGVGCYSLLQGIFLTQG